MLGLAVALAAMLAVPAQARPPGWSAGTTGRPLATCIRRAAPGDDPRAIARDLAGFDCSTAQKEFGSGDFWVISEPVGERSRSRRPLNARMLSLWQDRLTLHVLYADGRIETMADDTVGMTKRIQLGAVVEYPMPRLRAPVDRLLWKVEGASNVYAVVRNPRIATEAESNRANLFIAALYAAFGGLCIALLTYNLALWTTLRYRFQLAYAAMVAALMAYAFTSSGALAWLVPDIANTTRMRLNYLLLTVTAASAIWFARAFFEEHVFGPRMRMLIRVSIATLLLSGIGFAACAPLAPALAHTIYSWVFASILIPIVAIVVSAWVNRSNFLWLFGIAWAAPIVAGCLRVLNGLGVMPWSFWLDNSTLISMSAEALLSSIAITYRIRLLSRERDAALAAETVARRLADLDPLTGLLNRRAFLGHAIGRGGPQTLLILDLDRFKQVNDTIGHDGGDEVLRTVARMLRMVAPETALIARLGGEEFALLCNAAQPVDPDTILARLRATRMPYDLRVTASIGSAHGTMADERDWKSLYRAADQALFDAKSAGRDRARASIAA
ncbi:MAG: GGDEF domain-containing protein [Sphingomonas sp.]|uniref:GGDEF domain-containing protein n=1 Tax=Sphingomonas sp. TaxID=28214 RepID=UPI002610245F|nr:diguanylate cyclase [Sphingomonas sp.]MDK2768601.1 GGDEF domain-containing protein [Sphingomonas sp.]